MSWTKPFLEKIKANYFKNTYPLLLEIEKSDKVKLILKDIEYFVSKEGVQISTSQIRNIYDKAIKEKTANDLYLLKPNLAYTAARQDKEFKKLFFAFIDDLLTKVNDKNINSFKIIMEALVAYHKYYGKTK